MSNYMYAIDRSDEYLAHYGVKGMRWGVRKMAKALAKARASGNTAKLARLQKKIERKAAKYEKMSNSGKKYARRAALLGAGAAAAGGLAAAGTGRVGNAMRTVGMEGIRGASVAGTALSNVGKAMVSRGIRGAGVVRRAGMELAGAGARLGAKTAIAGGNLAKWGGSTSTVDALKNAYAQRRGADRLLANKVNRQLKAGGHGTIGQQLEKLNGISNDTIARAGAGLVGAGLAGAAGYNAYRAATTKRAGETARQYRSLLKSNGGGSRKRKRRG